MDSLPADQYTVTLTRSGQQPDCQSYVNDVIMTTSSDLVLFEGLEENSVYSVSIIAITFDLTKSVTADITTLTAGEYTRSYIIHICYLIYIIYILYIYVLLHVTSHLTL